MVGWAVFCLLRLALSHICVAWHALNCVQTELCSRHTRWEALCFFVLFLQRGVCDAVNVTLVLVVVLCALVQTFHADRWAEQVQEKEGSSAQGVANASHWVTRDQPDEVNRRLDEFLADM